MKYLLDPTVFALDESISERDFNIYVNRLLLWDKWLEKNPGDVYVLSNTEDILYKMFYLPENADSLDLTLYDYIIDAVDTVSAKVERIKRAKSVGVPVISSMGTGNKLKPEMLEVSDIYKTSVCPLAKVMRTRLKKEGIKALKVVYSKEPPTTNPENIIGSVPFVPSVAGLITAGEVIKDLIKQ